MSLISIRSTVCLTLYSIYGICLPAMKTARAIRDDDGELMKEQLTFWTVMALLGLLELICAILGLYQTTPPETRIILILWLTQPQWGGCHQIYNILVKPVFERYEDEIDKSVKKYSLKFWSLLLRQMRNLLWHIAFSEEDGIVAGLLAFLGQAHRVKEVLSWFSSAASAAAPSPLRKKGEQSAVSSSSSKVIAASKQKFLGEFLDMMYETLAVQAGYKLSKMRLSSVYMRRNNPYFLYMQGIHSNRRSSVNGTNDEAAVAPAHKFSLLRFTSFEWNPDDQRAVVVHLSPWWNYSDDQKHCRSRDRQETKFYLRLQDDTETEGLIYGLELSVMNARKVVLSALSKLEGVYERLLKKQLMMRAFLKFAYLVKKESEVNISSIAENVETREISYRERIRNKIECMREDASMERQDERTLNDKQVFQLLTSTMIAEDIVNKVKDDVLNSSSSSDRDPLFDTVATAFYEKLYSTKVERVDGIVVHSEYPIASAQLVVNCNEAVPHYGRLVNMHFPTRRKLVTDVSEIPLRHWVRAQVEMEITGFDKCDYLDCSISVFENKAKFYESTGKYRGSVLHFRDIKGKTADVFDIWTTFNQHTGESVLDSDAVLQVQMDEAFWAMSTIEERLKSLTYVQAIYWEVEDYFLCTIDRDKSWFENKCFPKISSCLDQLLLLSRNK